MKKMVIFMGIMVAYIVLTLFVFLVLPCIISTTIILEDNVRWTYKNHEWKVYDSDTELFGYKIYDPNNGDYIGRKDIRYYNSNWLVKEKKQYVSYDKSMLAVKSNKFKAYGFDMTTLTDTNVINKIIAKASVTKTGGVVIGNQIKIDLDSDGRDEIIYGISNIDEMGNTKFYVFAIYMNGEYKIIKKYVGENNPSVYVYAVVDVDGDSNLELIVKESYFSMSGCDYSLYSLVDGEYTEMISTGGSL